MISLFDSPVPGQGLTHELGGRPWQTPYQYATVDEAMEYYIDRLSDDDLSDKLLEVMETGVPLTTIANGLQLSSVMSGKHSIDVGMIVMPVLIEMMRLVGDSAGVEYDTGMEKKADLDDSTINAAVSKLRKKTQEAEPEEDSEEPTEDEAPSGGLMARR